MQPLRRHRPLVTRLVSRLPVALVAALAASSPLTAQITDASGSIRSSAWLVLGPFRQTAGCGAGDAELLANTIAPASIPCEYPVAGDEIDYDPFLAATVDYLGPRSDAFLPAWRAFEDELDDGLVNLAADTGWKCENSKDNTCADVVSWAVTYVELTAAEAAAIELCVGIGDGGQIWLDGELVFNRAGCRPQRPCDVVVPLTVAPGPHRVAVGAFDGGGDWQFSLALRRGAEPIVDGDAEWTFHGRERPPIEPGPCRALVAPVAIESCEVDVDSSVDVRWENPPEAAPEQEISVRVEGEEVLELPGDSSAANLPASSFPDFGESTVCVVNESGFESCCEVRLLETVTIARCERGPGGDVTVEWTNPFNAAREQTISVSIDDVEVLSLPGDAERATIPARDVPPNYGAICVTNASGEADCCNPRATTESGHIASRNWLVLGPFEMAKRIGCDGRERDEDLLRNFIAPSEIECEYPAADDGIDYTPGASGSSSYRGPVRLRDDRPYWRPLADGTPDDGDIDLRADPLAPGDTAGLMSWVATYVEYRGAEPVAATLCVGTDDSGQVWLDDVMVFNHNACGSRDDCDDAIGVTVLPGVHRIAVGVFNADGQWGMRAALRVAGEPVLDDPERFPDWVFHGRTRPESRYSCPSAPVEICGNTVDDDGDDLADCDDPDCAAEPSCDATLEFLRGDCNGDGEVLGNVSDAIFLLSFNFQGGARPVCLAACDANADGSVLGAVTDAVFLLNFNFRGSNMPPPAPFPRCGVSRRATDEALGCETPLDPCR